MADEEIDFTGELDDAAFEKMLENERRTKRGAEPTPPPLPPSKYSADTLELDKDGKVLVRCVSLLKPWASGKPMYFWRDYLVTVDEAISLDRRRFCVILQPVTSQGVKE